jgi:hypothetical protein
MRVNACWRRLPIRVPPVIVLLVAWPSVATAETAAEPARRFGVTRIYGGTFGQPQGLSASAGLIIGTVPARLPAKCAFSYWANGALAQVEPGLGGGKASLGWANTNTYFGFAVKGSALRTWGPTWGARQRTHVSRSRGRGCRLRSPELGLAVAGAFSWGLGLGF